MTPWLGVIPHSRALTPRARRSGSQFPWLEQGYAAAMHKTPEDVGLSSPGLERARAYVAACVERGEIAGAVMLVSRHDQVAQLACVGQRDVEVSLPMEPDTIFRIASMTKPITSVGALMLVEAGKLRLRRPGPGARVRLGQARRHALRSGRAHAAPRHTPAGAPAGRGLAVWLV